MFNKNLAIISPWRGGKKLVPFVDKKKKTYKNTSVASYIPEAVK